MSAPAMSSIAWRLTPGGRGADNFAGVEKPSAPGTSSVTRWP